LIVAALQLTIIGKDHFFQPKHWITTGNRHSLLIQPKNQIEVIRG